MTRTDNYDEPDNTELSYWDSYEDYYEEYYYEGEYYDYDWEQRDNPCSTSYYTQNRYVARNILASDLGIIAKGSNNNTLLVSVTHLVSAQSMPGTEITALELSATDCCHCGYRQQRHGIAEMQ